MSKVAFCHLAAGGVSRAQKKYSWFRGHWLTSLDRSNPARSTR
jgi:hypothetical protein